MMYSHTLVRIKQVDRFEWSTRLRIIPEQSAGAYWEELQGFLFVYFGFGWTCII